MVTVLNFSFFLWFLYSINSVFCADFKCPERGKVGGLKVPNVLKLIDKQTGYHASVEAIDPTRKKLINEYFDDENSVGFIDLEATVQNEMNRRYYYHSKSEKIAVQSDRCTRFDLTQDEKIKSIKDWFKPTDIVADSEMFKDLVHLGPTVLMIYANSISDKASFIGSELIDGRTVNHWFYCTHPNGPYIDFYFDVKTSLPYRFSLYYPEWIEVQEVISINETQTVKKQADLESNLKLYVYNFYSFKPLVTTRRESIPYPLGYGCERKSEDPHKSLPDFSAVKEFSMDMEAIITFSEGDLIKSTARVMKRGDVISYEINEKIGSVRSIEMPPPMGRFEVDENTGRCRYLTSDYSKDVTLITRWPFHEDHGFNLLYYLVMKPTADHAPTFIGDIPLGPYRVEEYRASNFFSNRVDAIVDYFYTKNNSDSVPSKVIFTKDRNDYYSNFPGTQTQVEVTIVSYADSYLDYEDRFDVSGCFEEPGSYTWFQLMFSNPDSTKFNMPAIKNPIEKQLIEFIPITRIGDMHVQIVDSNIYVTVKLYDRVHFIDAYDHKGNLIITQPANAVKKFKVEDCEQLCSSTGECFDFSYCSDYDCLIHESYLYGDSASFEYKRDCNSYSRSKYGFNVKPLVSKNYLSTMSQVLQQIRDKVSSGNFRLKDELSAEDLFIVNGPEEIGDVSQELRRRTSSRPLRSEDFPMIKADRHFTETQFKFEKSTLNDCFMACLNDDDCNAVSYCINQNKECILSGETSSSLKDKLEDKTSHADGCNIYQKSFINQFHKYPGKTLVLDAISTTSDVSIGDCASTCAQSKSFNCESFDYCENNNNRNESLCFLHVNHIDIDITREINITNWKFAEAGCSHYSKKSELDYEHKVGLGLGEKVKDSIIGMFDHLSVDHCASKCNSDPNCFTIEFCEIFDYTQVFDRSASLTSCVLTDLKPSNVNQPQLFEKPKYGSKICSIYINHKKIAGKSKTDPHSSELSATTSTKSNNFSLAMGLGSMVFILAFAFGFIGFKYATKKGVIS